jgi:SAM-dependent methyltransferase
MDRQTLDFYQTRASEWAAALPEAYSAALDGFLDRLAPGATILELGCGDGRDAERMIARGFAVDPSDGTPEMARLASARLGREVPVMRFDELEAEAEYDAAWCHTSLLHVPEKELPAILGRVHRALKPGGLHLASYKGGTGGGRDQFGRFYSYIPSERLEAAYRAAGQWTEFALDTRDGTSFGGAPTIWHNVTART